jgi:hypothetical protein
VGFAVWAHDLDQLSWPGIAIESGYKPDSAMATVIVPEPRYNYEVPVINGFVVSPRT